MADKNLKVGDIFVNIKTQASEVDKELSSAISGLKALKRSIAGISNLKLDKVQSNLKSISTLNFSGLENAFKPLTNVDTKALSSFNRQMKNIANLNFDNVDFAKLSTQVTALTLIIDPFIQKIQKAEPSLKAFSNAIDLGRVNAQLMVAEAKVNAINSKAQSKKVLDEIKIQEANEKLEATKKKLDDVNNKSNKTAKSFGKIFDIGKMYLVLNYMRRWGRTLSNIVTSAIDFEETLNKFQVSMGKDYYARSLQFVNSLTRAFNLSTESIMNYQSTFKNMLSALGNLSPDTSYELSESLTRMALDYASLFNVSTERAMEQFQAVLSGQIRSIRSVSGYDVSETSLFGIYQSLGGTKTMRQLDQVEKRLLRIIAVQQQMEKTGAVEDFSKTIDNTSNQIKQLKETIKEIGRWVGQLTMVYVQPLVEKILAGAVAIREMLKSLNISKGYEYENFLEKTNGVFGEIEDSANATNEAVESLKRNLLGFDKLNVLGTSSDSTGTDYSLLLNQIKSYSSSLDEVKNKANDMATKILEWLGYTKKLNEETNEYNWVLSDGFTNLEKIFAVISSIVTFLLSSAIFSKVANLINGIVSFASSNGTLSTVVSKLGAIVAIVAVLVGAFTYIYNSNEEFKKTIEGLIAGIKDKLSPVIESIKETLFSVYEKIKPFLEWLMDSCLPYIFEVALIAIGGLLDIILNAVNAIAKAIEVVVDLIKIFWGVIKSIPEMLKGIFMAMSGDSTAIDEWASKLKNSLRGVIEDLVEDLKEFGKSLVNFLISFVNTCIDVLNRVLSIKWPDWLGGGEWSVNIPHIPALANGGVITQPTTALVGEYAGAKSNPEIVTPENLMREVFIESMLPIAQAIVSGDREVVTAIQDLANRPVELNGRKVSENIYNDLQKVALRKGQTMFASAR